MNGKVSGLSVLLIALALLVSPVLAIGPNNAAEVGNNKNLTGLSGSVMNDNPSGNTILWGAQGRILLSMIASKGEGRMNNAIIANIGTLAVMFSSPDYANKWIYLSGDGGTNIEQFAFTTGPYAPLGSHGMLFWFTLFTFGSLEAAQNDALEHPDGIYLQIIVTGLFGT
jgi:hypothetical protein